MNSQKTLQANLILLLKFDNLKIRKNEKMKKFKMRNIY